MSEYITDLALTVRALIPGPSGVLIAERIRQAEADRARLADELNALSAAAVEEKRRREHAEARVERLREILRESPDYYEGDLVFYEWSRLDEVVNS